MKGYKVFNPDWTCRGKKYEVGKTYKEDVKPVLCEAGMHFCTNLVDCFNYYNFDPNNKVAIVEAVGEITESEGTCSKRATNKLKVIKQITWQEVLELCNIGSGNSGNRNSGSRNSGDRNSGYRNSGNHNSGSRNSGDRNSGNRNSGSRNSGDWNSGHWNSGYFNSDTPDKIRVFNKWCDIEVWKAVYKPDFLYFDLCEFIDWDDMSEEEKKQNPEAKAIGEYLRTMDYKQAFKQSFEQADHEDRMRVKDLPNFDEQVFFEISGIKISDYE